MEKQNYHLNIPQPNKDGYFGKETRLALRKQIKKFRETHPRCKYCIFHKFKDIPIGFGYWKCELKDKVLVDYLISFLYDNQGRFCKWFIAKEDDIEI